MLKESNDVLDLGQAVADALAAAKADGHIDWMDLPKFAPVIAAAKAAIEGGDQVPSELSGASTEDLIALAEKAVKVSLALVAAVISK